MLCIMNKAAIRTPVAVSVAGTQVPFDTTVISTNANAKLNSNAVEIYSTGTYRTMCQVTLANAASDAVELTLTAYGDGTAITGATSEITVPGSGDGTFVLEWPVQIKPAQSGTASISWYVSGATATITNATAIVSKYA